MRCLYNETVRFTHEITSHILLITLFLFFLSFFVSLFKLRRASFFPSFVVDMFPRTRYFL